MKEYGLQLIRKFGHNEKLWFTSERQRDIHYLAYKGIKNITKVKKIERNR